jgi:hypothetical protein
LPRVKKPWISFSNKCRTPSSFQGRGVSADKEQWQAFSSEAIRGFQEKLAAANAVSFNQLMELSEAVLAIA